MSTVIWNQSPSYRCEDLIKERKVNCTIRDQNGGTCSNSLTAHVCKHLELNGANEKWSKVKSFNFDDSFENELEIINAIKGKLRDPKTRKEVEDRYFNAVQSIITNPNNSYGIYNRKMKYGKEDINYISNEGILIGAYDDNNTKIVKTAFRPSFDIPQSRARDLKDLKVRFITQCFVQCNYYRDDEEFEINWIKYPEEYNYYNFLAQAYKREGKRRKFGFIRLDRSEALNMLGFLSTKTSSFFHAYHNNIVDISEFAYCYFLLKKFVATYHSELNSDELNNLQKGLVKTATSRFPVYEKLVGDHLNSNDFRLFLNHLIELHIEQLLMANQEDDQLVVDFSLWLINLSSILIEPQEKLANLWIKSPFSINDSWKKTIEGIFGKAN